MPWANPELWDLDLLSYVRETIKLRKDYPALRRGTYRTLLAKGELYACERAYQGQRLVAAFNTAIHEFAFTIPLGDGARSAQTCFGSASHVAVQNAVLNFTVPARSGVVFALGN